MGDPVENELDPMANRQVSHLANCFFYASKSSFSIMATEVDKLGLNERYALVLKVCYDVSTLFSSSFFFQWYTLFLLQMAFYLSYGLRDFSNISRARAEVEKMKGELKDNCFRDEKLTQ